MDYLALYQQLRATAYVLLESGTATGPDADDVFSEMISLWELFLTPEQKQQLQKQAK